MGERLFQAILEGLLPVAVSALLSWLVVVLARQTMRTEIPSFVVVLFVGFSVMGCMLGLLMGASRNPIVATALPVIVTLFSGILAYLFSKDALEHYRVGLPWIILGLASFVAFGAAFSALGRSNAERHLSNYDLYLHYCKEFYIASRKAFHAKAITDGKFDRALFIDLFGDGRGCAGGDRR
jgi:hypothetical protein